MNVCTCVHARFGRRLHVLKKKWFQLYPRFALLASYPHWQLNQSCVTGFLLLLICCSCCCCCNFDQPSIEIYTRVNAWALALLQTQIKHDRVDGYTPTTTPPPPSYYIIPDVLYSMAARDWTAQRYRSHAGDCYRRKSKPSMTVHLCWLQSTASVNALNSVRMNKHKWSKTERTGYRLLSADHKNVLACMFITNSRPLSCTRTHSSSGIMNDQRYCFMRPKYLNRPDTHNLS